jgi:broad specificity phosphatase PhoE
VDDPVGARPLTAAEIGADDGCGADVRLAIPDRLDATLVLVRHGESELIVQRRFQGRLDTPLSATGRRQAERVAARLARPHDPPALPIPEGRPLAIVHSPLARAADTAAAIGRAVAAGAEGPGVTHVPDERFVEIGQGEWEGRLASEIQATDGERLTAWRSRPTETWAPGGERLAEVRERVVAGLTDVLAVLAAAGSPGSLAAPQVGGYHDGPTTHPWSILVGHDGVFKVALLALFDLPLEQFWMWSSDLCGISVVEFRAGRPVVRAMNLTEHLAGLLDEAAQEATEERARSGAL